MSNSAPFNPARSARTPSTSNVFIHVANFCYQIIDCQIFSDRSGRSDEGADAERLRQTLQLV
jgi:hypothetical protein